MGAQSAQLCAQETRSGEYFLSVLSIKLYFSHLRFFLGRVWTLQKLDLVFLYLVCFKLYAKTFWGVLKRDGEGQQPCQVFIAVLVLARNVKHSLLTAAVRTR